MNEILGRWAVSAVLCAVVLGVASGCQTTNKDDESRLVPAARIPFIPYMARVPLQASDGPYPNLFTGASYAVWGGNAAAGAMARPALSPEPGDGPTMEEATDANATTALSQENGMGGKEILAEADMEDSLEGISLDGVGGKGEAEQAPTRWAMNAASVARGPVVVTCYLESQFSDMSIAYDAVGLRGIQFYLQLPDGTEVLPAQKVLDGELTEEPVGALRRYGRKLTLYFPSRVILVDNPAVTPAAQGVRLVLEGHGTRFYFEWPARPDLTATVKLPRWDEDAVRKTRSAYREISARAKRLSHEFD